jgi:hypothetical protein
VFHHFGFCADAAAATLRLVAAGPLAFLLLGFMGTIGFVSFSTILSSVAGGLWDFFDDGGAREE